MRRALRVATAVAGIVVAWQLLVVAADLPPYMLPGPLRVGRAWVTHRAVILDNAAITLTEILIGFLLGATLGAVCAMTIAAFRGARLWLLPLLVVSQAIPVFALAPLLVLWLGYGLASKVAMATLIIFFPVTTAFYDGLRRTDRGWLDLARAMNAGRWAVLRHVRMPAALPALASGLRVAAAIAPIGAIVGEWVGASAGLGYLMLHANARMQVDVMFAALATLALLAVTLYFVVDGLLRRALPWQPETLPADD